MHHLELLYGPYEPEYYYWEVVETARRLLATSALLLIPSMILRIVVAILISMATLKLYGYCEPFVDRSDDILAETLQWITCLLMLSMLLTKTNADNVQYYMIALQCFAVLVVTVLIFSDIGRERKAIKDLAREFHDIGRTLKVPDFVPDLRVPEIWQSHLRDYTPRQLRKSPRSPDPPPEARFKGARDSLALRPPKTPTDEEAGVELPRAARV